VAIHAVVIAVVNVRKLRVPVGTHLQNVAPLGGGSLLYKSYSIRLTQTLYERTDVRDEAAITVNGRRLSHEELEIMRMAVETLVIVMGQNIEQYDEGVTGTLTPPYLSALVSVQRFLEIGPAATVQ
jgi:hypothetical protein